MKHTILLLIALPLLGSCHTCRHAENGMLTTADSSSITSIALDASFMDSLFSEADFQADRLVVELLPLGGTRLEAEGVASKRRRGMVSESSATKLRSESSSHRIRDSTATRRERDAVVIAEPPSTGSLFPRLALCLSLIAIACLVVKMRGRLVCVGGGGVTE